MESNDIKKEKVKRILASIEESAYKLIDSGQTLHPMDLVMDLTITAYELDLMTDFVNKYKPYETDTADDPNKVIKMKPRDIH
jgi:hypothetical protein